MYAVIGSGKTGSHVISLLDEKGEEYVVFNSKNLATAEKLKQCQVAVCFVTGPIFLALIPTLLDARIPVVSAATGFDWPVEIKEQIEAPWIHAHNFSLGMNLVHGMINIMAKAPKLFDQYEFSLHEIHHTEKKDAPSGTALAWEKWLGHKTQISSERTGDVVGDHQLTLTTPFEKIELRHQALDRKIFAAGSLWAANKILAGEIPPGLHDFADLTLKELL